MRYVCDAGTRRGTGSSRPVSVIERTRGEQIDLRMCVTSAILRHCVGTMSHRNLLGSDRAKRSVAVRNLGRVATKLIGMLTSQGCKTARRLNVLFRRQSASVLSLSCAS